ncbi:bgs4, partial [Symbiodinium necroappetens]
MAFLAAKAQAMAFTLRCNVPASYSRESMKRLIRLNCDKVNRSVNDFEALGAEESELDTGLRMILGDQYDIDNLQWLEKGSLATEACENATTLLAETEAIAWRLAENETASRFMEATNLAVNA